MSLHLETKFLLEFFGTQYDYTGDNISSFCFCNLLLYRTCVQYSQNPATKIICLSLYCDDFPLRISSLDDSHFTLGLKLLGFTLRVLHTWYLVEYLVWFHLLPFFLPTLIQSPFSFSSFPFPSCFEYFHSSYVPSFPSDASSQYISSFSLKDNYWNILTISTTQFHTYMEYASNYYLVFE